jgi:sugar-phosphatase
MQSVPRIECRALLFDMDGVLIDSTAAVARVWKRWASEHGFDPETVASRAQGRPSITTIRELLPHADHLAENREVERREMEDLAGVTACPGAREMLSLLPTDLWALVTSSTKPLAEVRLRAAGLPIPKLFVTGSDVVNGKPHPEPFLKGAALVGFPPEQCIVVEDTPAGIRAGKLAGARVLAFRTTMPDSELRAAGPDWLAADCSSLTVVSASFDHGISLELET